MTVQEEHERGHGEVTLLSLHDEGSKPSWSVIGFI